MPVALVFPGQGSQRAATGLSWRETPGWRLVEQAGDALGRDVAALLLDADAEQLRATREAQVSTCLTSLLALEGLRTARPDLEVMACAGHSLGELTLVAVEEVLAGRVRRCAPQVRAVAVATPDDVEAL